MENPILSIHIPSNRPENIKKFFDKLEETAHDHSAYEVCINLDVGDNSMSAYLENEKLTRPFTIKYLNTFSGGFYNSWKPINDLLSITHPDVYFMTFLSDEFLFQTKGWDGILKSYINYYPDHIFRLKASQFRYRNYQDIWECGFAPDSITFYTKKWVDICGDWAPCFSSDAFQQCVSYYLFTSDPFNKEQSNRDIPLPNLHFSGEGASIGLSGDKAKKRIRGGIFAWSILMSYTMQTEAKRRAMKLLATISAEKLARKNISVIENNKKKLIAIINHDNNTVITTFSYTLSRCKFFINNNVRKGKYLYYTGGGKQTLMPKYLTNLRCFITHYLVPKYQWAENIYHRLHSVKQKIRQSN